MRLSQEEYNRRIKTIRKLYYKEGKSVREVVESMGISWSTLYKFMRRYNLKRRSSAETNRIYFDKQKPSFVLKHKLTEKEQRLKIAGIMLYWAEGAKLGHKNSRIDLANSNPRMIKVFLKFLREICGIDDRRLRCFLYCYADQDIHKIKKFWSQLTAIPLRQFSKPYIRKDFLPEKSGRMKHGLIHIRYGDKKLLLQVESWINQYLEKEL